MLADICNGNRTAEADREKVDLVLARILLCFFNELFKIIDNLIHIAE